MTISDAPVPDAVRRRLADLADAADDAPAWPEPSWQALRSSGALSWLIPIEYGGLGRDARELLEGYEALAACCLTTAFILSQREAACRRLIDGPEHLRRALLPALARGEAFATVGLSQLTTSRQHGAPSLAARETPEGLLLDGVIPWVTGAAQSDHTVIGATLGDGRQVLAVLPAGTPGVSVGPPMDLVALRGSVTAEVRCESVTLGREWLLAGPAERVMQSGRGGTGGLETSCLALGLCAAAIDLTEREAAARPELRPAAEALRRRYKELRGQMHWLADEGAGAQQAADLRAQANSLALGATQSALTASKGAGFLRGHPAGRWARQAPFFLVWSCPWPAASATLDRLTACS